MTWNGSDFTLGAPSLTSVDEYRSAARGLRMTLAGYAPHADAVAFEIESPLALEARLDVFDTQGRRVATLLDGPLAAGRATLRWDVATANGGVASGVYFARLSFPGGVRTAMIPIAPPARRAPVRVGASGARSPARSRTGCALRPVKAKSRLPRPIPCSGAAKPTILQPTTFPRASRGPGYRRVPLVGGVVQRSTRDEPESVSPSRHRVRPTCSGPSFPRESRPSRLSQVARLTSLARAPEVPV
jgi:hypothetical protein